MPSGRSAAAAACGGCHGEDGNSSAPIFPKLAGQQPAYLAKQLYEALRAQGYGRKGTHALMLALETINAVKR